MPVTVRRMKRKNDSPPRHSVYETLTAWRFTFTGWRWYSTLFMIT
jgi:hypothetical protein